MFAQFNQLSPDLALLPAAASAEHTAVCTMHANSASACSCYVFLGFSKGDPLAQLPAQKGYKIVIRNITPV